MAGVRSASIGVWVGVGSRDESPALHGCSHFLEHLLFKGTEERSALDISIALDAVGGEFNAFTAKEYTCFHARVLDEDLPLAVDVLGDMITGSRLTADDVEAERDVILDEIAMHDDDPDDVVHNLFAAQAWGDSPLGRPIAGTVESITALTRDADPRGSTGATTGRRTWWSPRPATSTTRRWSARSTGLRPQRLAGPRGGAGAAAARGAAAPGHARHDRGHPALRAGQRGARHGGPHPPDDRRFALGVLNTALGGGTSSRLFQEVREHRGLAYSVFSFASHHADSGLVGVSVGCLPSKLDDVLAVVRAELAKVAADGITAEELARGKGMLRGGLVLGLEDSGSRMSRIGKAELVYDELLSIDEVIARIDGVTLEDVREIAAEIFSRPEVLAVVGPASSPSPTPTRVGELGRAHGVRGSRRLRPSSDDAGAGGGPQHAGEGADDEPLGGAGATPSSAAQLRVAAQALDGQHDRQPLGPAGDQGGEDRGALQRPDPGAAAEHLPGRLGRWTARAVSPRSTSAKTRAVTGPPPTTASAPARTTSAARARPAVVDARRRTAATAGRGREHQDRRGRPDPHPRGGTSPSAGHQGGGEEGDHELPESSALTACLPDPSSSRPAARWVTSSRARRPSTMPAACARWLTADWLMPSRRPASS